MKLYIKIFFLFIFLCCNTSIKDTDTIFGKVIGVKDGDTIEILSEGESEIIRLLDIDCPEKKQAFGKIAKKFTSDLCFGKYVKIKINKNRDRYNRILGTVYIDNIILNKELVKNGLAWHFKKYSKNIEYAELENTARKIKIGLWGDKNPIPPWEFRKNRNKS